METSLWLKQWQWVNMVMIKFLWYYDSKITDKKVFITDRAGEDFYVFEVSGFFLWTSDSVVVWPRNSHHPIYTTSHIAPSYMRPHSTQQYEIKYAFSSVSFLSSHLMSMTRIELRQVSFHHQVIDSFLSQYHYKMI